jgi:hypothetical protein
VCRVVAEDLQHVRHGLAERDAVGQEMDQRGERARGQVAGGMTVGDLGALGGRLEGPPRGTRAQAERRRAHDRAAAFRARVDRTGFAERRGAARLGVQPGQAGRSGGTLGVQPPLVAKPAGTEDVLGAAAGRRGVVPLGVQPSQVGEADHRGQMADALVGHPYVGAQDAFQREHRHLRVIGDQADLAPAIRDEAADPRGAVPAANAIEGGELDRCA